MNAYEQWTRYAAAKQRERAQWANSGGPMSRRRTERVVASVLRDDTSRIHLPRVIRAGLHFGDRDPLSAVLESLARVGLDDAELLRERYPAPESPLLVRVVPDARWGVRVGQGTDESILRQALAAGTLHLVPVRPVAPGAVDAREPDAARRALRARGVLCMNAMQGMNAMQVRALVHELVDENPFAIRAVLKILAVEFTNAVPTLAVTNEPRPRLLINLEFVAAHCRTDEHVKALLCHEFLHVLLRHTDEPGRPTPARHLALDAVINAIIHRQLGEKYSSMMAGYYARFARPAEDAAADAVPGAQRVPWAGQARRQARPAVVAGVAGTLRAASSSPTTSSNSRAISEIRCLAPIYLAPTHCSVTTRTTRRSPRCCSRHSPAPAGK